MNSADLEVHATHAAHTTGHRRRSALVFRQFSNGSFRRDQQACNRSSVLKRSANDLRRIDNASRDKVFIHVCRCVEALALVRSEEHTSELQSLMRISYAVFCLKKKTNTSIPI